MNLLKHSISRLNAPVAWRGEGLYKVWVLLVFVAAEVASFEQEWLTQAIIAGVEYTFVLALAFVSVRHAVMYFIAFTLLAAGGWSYVLDEQIVGNFWGLRFGPISVNIVFAGLFATICAVKKHSEWRSILRPSAVNLMIWFAGYSVILGALFCIGGRSTWDNWLRDTMVYVPAVLFACMFWLVGSEGARSIIATGFFATVVGMGLSALTGVTFNYGDGMRFAIMNGFSYIVLCGIGFVGVMYPFWLYVAQCTAVAVLFGTGKLFIGGKTLVLLVCAVIWSWFVNRRTAVVFTAAGIGVALLWPAVSRALSDRFYDGTVARYKFDQTIEAFELNDLGTVATRNTSMGNIVAEGQTIAVNLWNRPFQMLFGAGCGAGTADVFGYLAPMAGPGAGYSLADAMRNDFVRMHLPVYNVLLKAGLVGLLGYLWLIYFCLRRRNVFAFLAAAVIATVVTNSKEMLLLSLALLYASQVGAILPNPRPTNARKG